MILIEKWNPHCIASIYLRVLHFNLFVIRWSDSVPNVLSRFHLSTEEICPKTTEIRLIKDWFRKESRSSKVEGRKKPYLKDLPYPTIKFFVSLSSFWNSNSPPITP